jgi:hypothetical protein
MSATTPRDSRRSACAQHIEGENFRARGDVQRFEIAPDQRDSRSVRFDKKNLARAAAQRLDADCASTGIEIKKHRVLNARPEDVEERFAQTIACGAQLQSAQTRRAAASIFACNDAHGYPTAAS